MVDYPSSQAYLCKESLITTVAELTSLSEAFPSPQAYLCKKSLPTVGSSPVTKLTSVRRGCVSTQPHAVECRGFHPVCGKNCYEEPGT